jgi:hypothetical protein
MSPTATKEHAHHLIDQMAPAQVSTVVELLEDLLDPLAHKLATAPLDDEPTTESDRVAIARSHTASRISTEELLAGFGLTVDDFHHMATASVDSAESHP